MSKGLEALDKIIEMALEPNGYLNFQNAVDTPYYQTIEKELIEGELAMTYVNAIFDIMGDVRNGNLIIDTIAKQRKALEIIKRKYNFGAGGCLTCCGLTQEEYDLLKKVLL